MPYIDIIPLKRATGPAQKAVRSRACSGRAHLGHCLHYEPQPPAMKTSLDFYGAIMHGPSPLSRGQREMLAVVVSATNHCVY